jgi:DNA recombination protein RmuC
MLDYALILLLILAAGSVFFQFKMQSSLVKIKEIRDKVTQLNDRVLQLAAQMGSLEKNQEKADTAFREEMARNREEISAKLEHIRSSVDLKLRQLQEDNSKKLEEMRATGDDKLHHALEQKLSESFKLVSERLEQVYKGLGEMQNLAVGVGDLKKVLSNVKTRGIFGEVQLGNILEELLTPEQYYKNVATRPGSKEVVEYAVRLPGREEGATVLLPIDAKFPQEDYLRLQEAYDLGDINLIEQAGKDLENRIRSQAKDICQKYLCPPDTVEFGIMFLPTESLYAEILRRPGLVENIQRDYKVNITGPSTLAAFLSSLSVGFRTLAIQKRSSEVWSVLGAVKTEFNKYNSVLAKVQKQLQAASNTIDDVHTRTRVLERKLKTVEEIPSEKAAAILGETTVISEATAASAESFD